MFFRTQTSGPRTYLQVVENRWEGGRSRQRVTRGTRILLSRRNPADRETTYVENRRTTVENQFDRMAKRLEEQGLKPLLPGQNSTP